MGKRLSVFLMLWVLQGTFAQQQIVLPPDLRSHNQLAVNPSIFNPVFSLDQSVAHRVGFWSRWQWQTPDADPTTLLINYSGQKDDYAFGGGFFQNNTSFYRQTGVLVNYAFDIPVWEGGSLSFGANLLAYQREVTNPNAFLEESIIPFSGNDNEFILQLAPAIQLNIGSLGLAVTSDNLFDFNLNRSGAVTESNEKILTGMAHYRFYLDQAKTDPGARSIRPMIYIRSVPGYDTQLGINALWSDTRFWAQGGYNSFYGPSLGVGGIFLKRLRLGGILEFGSGNAPDGNSTTYELVAAIDFGPADGRKKVVGFDVPTEDQQEDAFARAARMDSIQQAEAARLLAMERRRDSLDSARRAAELAETRRKQDSIQQAQEAALALEEVVPEEGERYQEISAKDGLEPGFYLIANVFGTKKYYEAFMNKLSDQGLEPKSFYLSSNSYNYVYLKRFNTITQARVARDSNLGGRYTGELWIFRIR
jgi:type IX secretion system PorP/SprF family membrane protein